MEINLGRTSTEDDNHRKNAEVSGSINDIIKHYENHPSILKIKEIVKFDTTFVFNATTQYEMGNRIATLDTAKTLPLSPILEKIYNKSIILKSVPNSLKLAEVTPAYKNDETINKKKIIDQLASYLVFLKFSKGSFIVRYSII